MLERKNDGDRAGEEEEGEKCNVDPFVSSSTVRGPNSFLSLCYALWPLSNLGFSLSHTHPIRAIIVLMIPFISVSLWMHLFSKVILY